VTPTSLRIGAITYRITRDPDDWLRIEHETQRKGDFGHTKHDTAVIYLNPENPPTVTRLTLWHEVLHALNMATMGAPDWKGLGKTTTDREETVIRMWEHPTLAVLRDNPELVAYLTGDDVAAEGDK
jgi:hypothetical protein